MDKKQSVRITNGKYCGQKCESLKDSVCSRYDYNILEAKKVHELWMLARCQACLDD